MASETKAMSEEELAGLPDLIANGVGLTARGTARLLANLDAERNRRTAAELRAWDASLVIAAMSTGGDVAEATARLERSTAAWVEAKRLAAKGPDAGES